MANNLLILERSNSEISFKKDGTGEYILEGIFSEIGVKNKNNRIYDEAEFIPHVEELAKKVSQKKILGELDHPKQFEVSLQNVSHVIESLTYDTDKKQVIGKIKLLDTDAGKQAKALVDAGVPVHISSRAAGVVEGNGHVKIKRLFTYDLVADPGFENAQLNRVNESFGLENDDDIQIFEMESDSISNDQLITSTSTIDTTQPEVKATNESKGESFISIADFNEYTKLIKKEFDTLKESIKESQENSMTLEEKGDLNVYLDQVQEKYNQIETKFKSLDENVDNLIAHNDYVIEGLESVKKYAELIALKTDQNIEYSNKIAELAETEFTSLEDKTSKINETVNELIEFGDLLSEQTENTANYTNFLKTTIEEVGSHNEKIVEIMNENINEFNDKNINEIVIENINESSTTKSIVNETKLDTSSIIEESNDEFMNNINSQLTTLIESAKKQKAVEENEDMNFLNFLSESHNEKFNELDKDKQNKIVESYKSNKWVGSKGAENLWEHVYLIDSPKLDWLSNMPAKYQETWNSLSEEKKSEISNQASVSKLENQIQINSFWNSRDLREVKPTLENNELNENINSSDQGTENAYMEKVKAGLTHRFRFNK